MTLHPLDFDFPLMSDLSRRPPHGVGAAEFLPELDDELAHRRQFYPRLVAKHAMSEEAAARHIAILIAIRSDQAGYWDRSVTWQDKVRELRRELAMRRNAWPKRIAKPSDPLTAEAAARRMERLEAIHFAYWMDLDFWHPDVPAEGLTLGERVALIRPHAEARREWEMAQFEAGNPAARRYLTPAEYIAEFGERKAA